MTASRTPDAILDRQLDAWDEVMEEQRVDPLFAKIVASQKAWCERVGFYQSMNTPDYRRAFRHGLPGPSVMHVGICRRRGHKPLARGRQ